MRAFDAMTEEEADHATSINTLVGDAITDSMENSARSDWSRQGKIGVSDIGGCREYLRRTMVGAERTDEQDDYAAAFIGTAIGALAEHAVTERYPYFSTQLSVTVSLDIRGYQIELPGHPDLVAEDTLVDFKTKDGLGVVRRTGPTDQQWWQVALYYEALRNQGRLPENGWLTLCFIDRSGREAEPVSFSRRFDPALVAAAMDWLDDVIYAIENGEEASKDKPRDWCFACCPFASDCRGGVGSDVTGKIDDPILAEAIEIYVKANETIRLAEKDKKSAKSVLDGRTGNTDEWSLRWVTIPGGSYTVDRQPYERIALKRLDPKKRGKTNG